jgi:hypothetical protein
MKKVYRVEVDQLKDLDIAIIKSVYREGERHLKYYHSTMHIFKNPEKRIKTYDTLYYEQVMPFVIDILRNRGEIQ